MSTYECAGGSLKLKGVSDHAVSKKKKKKSKNKELKIASVSKPDLSDHSSSEKNPLLTYFHKSSDTPGSASVGPQEIGKLPKHHREVLEFKEKQQRQLSAEEAAKEAAGVVIKKPPAKTKAELAYERRMQERLEEKILERAEKSHKEHVEAYNSHLDSLSEYNDIPKVSWTK